MVPSVVSIKHQEFIGHNYPFGRTFFETKLIFFEQIGVIFGLKQQAIISRYRATSSTIPRTPLNTYQRVAMSFGASKTHGDMSLRSQCPSARPRKPRRPRSPKDAVGPQHGIEEEDVGSDDVMFLLDDSDQRTVDESLGSSGRLHFKESIGVMR